MSVRGVFANLAVADVEAAAGWYERLFGRPADAAPMEGLAEWHFPPSAMLQLVADTDRAGRSMLTLDVDDLDRELAGLRERGLEPGPIDDTSEFVRFATVTDPEGNTINLIEQR